MKVDIGFSDIVLLNLLFIHFPTALSRGKEGGGGDGKTVVRDKTKRENRSKGRFSRSREVMEFPLW